MKYKVTHIYRLTIFTFLGCLIMNYEVFTTTMSHNNYSRHVSSSGHSKEKVIMGNRIEFYLCHFLYMYMYSIYIYIYKYICRNKIM